MWHLGQLVKLFVYVLLKELFFISDFLFLFPSLFEQPTLKVSGVRLTGWLCVFLYKSLFKLCFQLFSKTHTNTSLVRTHIHTHTHPLTHWVHLTLSECRQLKAVRATLSLSVSSLFFSHFPPSLILTPPPSLFLFVRLAAESSQHWKIPPTYLHSQYPVQYWWLIMTGLSQNRQN